MLGFGVGSFFHLFLQHLLKIYVMCSVRFSRMKFLHSHFVSDRLGRNSSISSKNSRDRHGAGKRERASAEILGTKMKGKAREKIDKLYVRFFAELSLHLYEC